jgi:hypothetical protein
VDFVCLSYTRTVTDVREAREFLDACGLAATKIFAKLESRQVRDTGACGGMEGGSTSNRGQCS